MSRFFNQYNRIKWIFLLLLCIFIFTGESKSKFTIGKDFSIISIKNKGLECEYDIKVGLSGDYYISAFCNGPSGMVVSISVDNDEQGIMVLEKNGYQTTFASESGFLGPITRTFNLAAGRHTVKFKVDKEPNPVDRFKLGLTKSACKYDIKFPKISKIDFNNKKPGRRKNEMTSPLEQNNPEYEYVYSENYSFQYSYHHNYIDLPVGDVSFETKGSSADPIMYLFHQSDPSKGSWSNDDYDGFNSKITANITNAGYYTMLIMEFNTGGSSECEVWKDGEYYQHASLYGVNILSFETVNSGNRAYFTSTKRNNGSGDTKLYLFDNSTWPRLVKAYNDDYNNTGIGNFSWYLDSRINTTEEYDYFSIIEYLPGADAGNADVYFGLKVDDGISGEPEWPNLKDDDALLADDIYYDYNCIGWSGGMTDGSYYYWDGERKYVSAHIWPPRDDNPWYDDINDNAFKAFKNYWGNKRSNNSSFPRYTGAYTYTNDDADSDNASVALWRTSGEFTHGSVRVDCPPDLGVKPNNHLHGYSWESKCGSLQRVFHPRDDIGGSGSLYGEISHWFRWTGGTASLLSSTTSNFNEPISNYNKGLTLKESITLGLTELDYNDEFKPGVFEKCKKMRYKTSRKRKKEFERCYQLWKVTWKDLSGHSNPYAYTKSMEYADLISLCKQMGNEAWVLLFYKLVENGDYFATLPLEELSFPEYEYLMTESIEVLTDNPISDNGKFRAYNPMATWLRYLEKLFMAAL